MLENIRNNDFEDIAVTSDTGTNYIYIGDIGNNWYNHCMGIDQSHRMIHIIKEPNLDDYKRFVAQNQKINLDFLSKRCEIIQLKN